MNAKTITSDDAKTLAAALAMGYDAKTRTELFKALKRIEAGTGLKAVNPDDVDGSIVFDLVTTTGFKVAYLGLRWVGFFAVDAGGGAEDLREDLWTMAKGK
jgi:hypothetical protein